MRTFDGEEVLGRRIRELYARLGEVSAFHDRVRVADCWLTAARPAGESVSAIARSAMAVIRTSGSVRISELAQRCLKSNDARIQFRRNADLLIEAPLELADSKSRLARRLTLKIDDVKVRFIKPDVAAVDEWWEMTGARDRNGQEIPLRKGLLNLVMTKQDAQWVISVMHNMDLPVSP